MEEKDNLEVGASEAPETEEEEQETVVESEEQDNPQEDLESEADSDNQEDVEDEEDEKILRYKQQIKGSKEEAQRLRQMVLDTEIAKAWEDANAVLELNKKDPKMAKQVAEHYGFNGIEAVELFIKKQQAWDTNLYSEEEIVKRAEQIAEKKLKELEHQNAVDKINKKIGKLPKEYQEDANEYVNELIDGKLIDSEKASMYAEMVTLYVQKKKAKADKRIDWLAEFSTTWVGQGAKKATESKNNYIVVDGRLVLDTSQD